MTKVLLDDWVEHHGAVMLGSHRLGVFGISPEDRARARLAAAAPALVRALLEAEVSGVRFPQCPVCFFHRGEGPKGVAHAPVCSLDAALAAAGLPDQASRNEARREIGQ